jgi:hypothetical protein
MTESTRLAREAFGIYLSCLCKSLVPSPHRPTPVHLRRALFCLVVFPALLALQLIHWACLFVDELLFPQFRKTEIQGPVWITGIPRSGTTFVHRLLANDDKTFTTFTTWECLLAPSVIQKRVFLALRSVDRNCGSPLKRLVESVTRRFTGSVREIHEISLGAPEEDYLALLPAAGCFFPYLAFPFSNELRDLARLEKLPEDRRNRLLDFYHLLLQKHLYVREISGQRILSKNAAWGSWIPWLAERYPDAGFILMIREPSSALASQISSIRDALRHFGVGTTESTLLNDFGDLFKGNIATINRFLGENPRAHAVLIDQGDLKMSPEAILRSAVRNLNLPLSPELETALNGIDPGHRSGHQYRCPPDTKIDDCFMKEYRQALKASQRIPSEATHGN